MILSHMTVTWDEVNERWPWRRVLRALDVIMRERHVASHTLSILAASYLNVHRREGATPITARDVLHPAANPWYDHEDAQPLYSEGVIEAFEVAFGLKLTGNAALSVFGMTELRASGFTGKYRRQS